MQIFIVEGEHPFIPGTPRFVCATEALAQSHALELVNLIRTDFNESGRAVDGFEPLDLATDPAKWSEALRETQTAILRRDDQTEVLEALEKGEHPWGYSSDDDALDQLSECWVDITTDEVEQAADMAEPLPLATIELYRLLAGQVESLMGTVIDDIEANALCVTLAAIEAADPTGEPGTTVPISMGINPAAATAFVVKVAAAHDGTDAPIDYQDHAAKLVALATEARELATGEPPAPPRIMVVIDGGVITDVLSDQPVRWFHIDYDTDGSSPAEDELYAIPQDGGDPQDAFRSEYGPTTVDPAFMDRASNAERVPSEEAE